MSLGVRSVSGWENLVYNLCYAVPLGLQGTFTRNRFWVTFFARAHPDPAAVRFVGGLRKKYGTERLWVRLLTTRSLLVLDPDGVGRVLDHSPDIYADGRPKREGMQVFQPNAVTISRGDDWRERRRFNEAVLNSGHPVHRYAEAILAIVRDEIAPAGGPAPRFRTWQDFDGLFGRIARQVIFGRSARDDTTVTDLLKRLLEEANRPIKPKKSKHFDPFYERIRLYLARAEPASLAALCGQVPSGERTRVENQIPHWMFASWETLGANTARALATILAHPRAEALVREELARSDLSRPAGIADLRFLEACIQEAMRLWPTTPMLVRATVAEAALDGETLPSGTQVLIWNSFNHRDRERYPLADTFCPEAWADGRPSPLFNHLSSGPQVCAGIDLLLFIAKAVIATILAGGRYRLERPPLDPARPLPYAYNYFDLRLLAG